MNKRTIIVATALFAALGTAAAVYAQGPRHFHRGGDGQFGYGEPGGDGLDMGSGFRGHFRGPTTKEEHDTHTRERFARLDKNSDGFVDAAEFEAAFMSGHDRMRQKLGLQGAHRSERLIRMFDTNKDGKVSKEEHVSSLRKLFAELDLNGDGRITDEDLPPMMRGRNVLAKLGDAPGTAGPLGRGMEMGLPRIRILIGADTNKDGIVTLDEALTAGELRFSLLDHNKDGAIDKADFEALRKEMIDYRTKRALHHFGGSKEGRISREQFNAKAQERFVQMDLNGDGTITRDERPNGSGSHQGGLRARWHTRPMGEDRQQTQPSPLDRR